MKGAITFVVTFLQVVVSMTRLELLELVERMLTRRHYVCRKENIKMDFNEVDEILELIVGF